MRRVEVDQRELDALRHVLRAARHYVGVPKSTRDGAEAMRIRREVDAAYARLVDAVQEWEAER